MKVALKVILTIIIAVMVVSASYFIYTEYFEDEKDGDENSPPYEPGNISPDDGAIDAKWDN